jgi:hypothetical protein
MAGSTLRGSNTATVPAARRRPPGLRGVLPALATGARLSDRPSIDGLDAAIERAEQEEQRLSLEVLRVRQEISRLRLARLALRNGTTVTSGPWCDPLRWANEIFEPASDVDVEAAMETDPHESWTVFTLEQLLPGNSLPHLRRRLRQLAKAKRITIDRPQNGAAYRYTLVANRPRRVVERARPAPSQPVARTLRERILVLLAVDQVRGATLAEITERLGVLHHRYLNTTLWNMVKANEVDLGTGDRYRIGVVHGPAARLVARANPGMASGRVDAQTHTPADPT